MDTNNSLHKLSEVASRIKELRDIMGWSITEMAEKTDVSEEIYISYESGKVDIPFSFIHKCALAFDVELTELLEGHTAKLSSYTITRKGKGQGTAKENGIDIAAVCGDVVDALSVKQALTGVWRFKAADDAQGGCLTAAGRTENRDKFLVVYIEIDVVENAFSVKFLDDVVKLNDLLHGGLASRKIKNRCLCRCGKHIRGTTPVEKGFCIRMAGREAIAVRVVFRCIACTGTEFA